LIQEQVQPKLGSIDTDLLKYGAKKVFGNWLPSDAAQHQYKQRSEQLCDDLCSVWRTAHFTVLI